MMLCNGREIEIMLNGRLVDAVIDGNDEETFDLTEAVEVLIDDELTMINEGDTLIMTVHI